MEPLSRACPRAGSCPRPTPLPASSLLLLLLLPPSLPRSLPAPPPAACAIASGAGGTARSPAPARGGGWVGRREPGREGGKERGKGGGGSRRPAPRLRGPRRRDAAAAGHGRPRPRLRRRPRWEAPARPALGGAGHDAAVRAGRPAPCAAPGRAAPHQQARPLPGQECLVRGQEHHADRGPQRLRVQVHPEQGLPGTVFQLQRPQHLPPVHGVPGALRLLHAGAVHVGDRDAGLPGQRGHPARGQAGGEDPALQLPGVRQGAEPRGRPLQRLPERRGEPARRGRRAPPLRPPAARGGGAARPEPPPPPRGGGRRVSGPSGLSSRPPRRAVGREGVGGLSLSRRFPRALLPAARAGGGRRSQATCTK